MAEAFEVVVVGSGSAGAVVAARLATAGRKVLLLEAGGPDTRPEILVPLYHTKLFKTEEDWVYYTEPQPAVDQRRIYWPRGKVLGGCSSCNFMMVMRGHPENFEVWGERGNPEWTYAKVLPYFKALEDWTGGASEYRGVGGPVRVDRLKCVNPLTHRFLEAAVSSGIPRTEDHSAPPYDGVDHVQTSQRGGQRSSVVRSYLEPARGPNLTIRTRAHALRILIEGGRARGVEYLHQGEVRVAHADAVVVSGGSINSPQLLLLSGVGPPDALRERGIPVVHPLPGVGQGMRDHFVVPVNYHCRLPVSLATAELAENQDMYVSSHDGPLSSTMVEGTALVRTDPARRAPNIAINFVPTYFLDYGFKTYDGHAFTFTVNLRQADSVGQVSLASADPLVPARIEPNYLSAPGDLDALVEGILLARMIARQRAFDGARGRELGPGESARTPTEIAAYVRAHGQTEFHPIGTCRMGDDPLAVVDQSLKVRGLEGLWVADASVMPGDLSSPTNITTILIGERAAENLLASP